MSVTGAVSWRAVLLLLIFSLSVFMLVYSLGDRVNRYFRGVKPGVTLEGVAV